MSTLTECDNERRCREGFECRVRGTVRLDRQANGDYDDVCVRLDYKFWRSAWRGGFDACDELVAAKAEYEAERRG